MSYTVKKVLNNNVLIAGTNDSEVVMIGKGIGFKRQAESTISEAEVEKLFVLRNQQEQDQFKKLLPHVDEELLKVVISSIELIRERTQSFLNEHIHVALTDHIVFAVNRLMRGMSISNPFLLETKALYPYEYEIAKEVVQLINDRAHIYLPEGEVGFIALHIHSAMMNKNVREVNSHSQLIGRLIQLIETQFDVQLDKESIDYMRLVRHLRYTIERVVRGEKVDEPEKIALLLKEEYPLCYNLSWKLIKIMQQTLKKPVYDAEAVYLTMHLQRIQTKMK
ncbi:glucose PTS transporter transcription antiterminator GlcT [Jeotgalibacillus sp. R-1-5s-1]|uniref:glucose PTS transporter transcription antiterminator GlcT n=1 Tax=Jeotgalibacillus sp. R-1-5s-1 TaxID=2555897 RepID=UPI00106D3B8A|nr:transcription antiterminator [Jeotgalibacillus sp. R-1-5s-1]TFD93562.1 transcription antiterminator [Jeotgalibacillus sp. R-1-5s-1]